MTTADLTAFATPSLAGRGFASRARAAVQAGLARMKARHDCRRMMALGDAPFRDIGVAREDLRRAMLED
jgi:hypothetical protein